jgi:hypothetical protein
MNNDQSHTRPASSGGTKAAPAFLSPASLLSPLTTSPASFFALTLSAAALS